MLKNKWYFIFKQLHYKLKKQLTYFGNQSLEFSTTNIVSVRTNLQPFVLAAKRSRMGKNACFKMCTSSHLHQVIASSAWYTSMPGLEFNGCKGVNATRFTQFAPRISGLGAILLMHRSGFHIFEFELRHQRNKPTWLVAYLILFCLSLLSTQQSGLSMGETTFQDEIYNSHFTRNSRLTISGIPVPAYTRLRQSQSSLLVR